MDGFVRITAPTNNVNDDSVTVFQLFVKDGDEVKKGQSVMAVETSKATIDIESPENGFIKFVARVGDEIPNGGLLAVIAGDKEKLEDIHIERERGKEPPAFTAKTEEAAGIRPVTNEITLFGIFDKHVTLGEVYVKNGQKAEKDSALCRIRSGDHTEIVSAPAAGYVHWNMEPYSPVKAEQALGFVSGVPYPVGDEADHVQYESLRVSNEAQRLLDERRITAADLGLHGLVTAGIVRRKLGFPRPGKMKVAVLSDMAAHNAATLSGTGKYEKVSKAKRSEAAYLSDANRDTVVSQVSVLVPTQGIFTACAEDPELAGRFSAIIVFEAGRLLRGYRHMLSVYNAGKLFVYDHINIGYALSIGDGLKVPVIRDADQKELGSIMAEKQQFIEKYLAHELTPGDLEGGTFTITDLSSAGCYMFNPVLNLGQSVILGIGGENPRKTDYPLILAFDHRVTDGATATEFLCRLKERLVAHETVLLGKPRSKGQAVAPYTENMVDTGNLACASCFRTVRELEERGHYLVKVVDRDGEEKHICSLCLAGY